MIIYYDRHGEPISDFEVVSFIMNNINNKEELSISTENVIIKLREKAIKGIINPNDIKLICEGVEIKLDDFGSYEDKEHNSFYENSIDEILRHQLNKLK